MTEIASSITTDIDFESAGKQVGYLKVPHGRDDSALGTLLVPVTVVRNAEGPTLLLAAGSHGDEYEGPVALMKLARDLRPEAVKGCVIILPALNLPALQSGHRHSPIDGKAISACFPGSRQGTITEAIAHFVRDELVDRADVVLDLQSGGRSMIYLPNVAVPRQEDREQMARALSAARAFGAPVGLVRGDLDREGTLAAIVGAGNKLYITTGLGGGGMVSPDTVTIAETGIGNLLKHFGVIEGDIVPPRAQGRSDTRLMQMTDAESLALAHDAGIYEPFVEIGDAIEASQPLGQIHFVEDLDRRPRQLLAWRAGLLIARRVPGRVERGDCVAIIAEAYPE
ncbi:MAG: N-alpha-acetyl diaminobutyric acid deacetylase DoeB [Alphaproteobacteria bacterium]|nr:N-alpha-acetyl diaminobutyric acid deacetylase DoeB [Alphaproteobacteria bacterium]